MLSEKTLADIQVKMNDVNYLWQDNFLPDFKGYLNRLSALTPPSIEESYSSFGSVFFKPRHSSGYGLAEQNRAAEEQTLDNDFVVTPRLGR